MTSVTSDRRQGLNSSAAIKVPCRVASTANIPSLAGLLTIDGVVLASGDRVLVKDQTVTTQNGVYVADTGNWTRDLDFDGAYDVVEGTIVPVLHGNTNATTSWWVTTVLPAIGSALAFANSVLSAASSSVISFLQAGAGAIVRTLQSKVRERVSVFDFGVIGDGATDDTAAIALAEAYCYTNNKILDFGSACCKITAGITLRCAFRFDKATYGDGNATPPAINIPGIYPTGTGYTAVTVQTTLGQVENLTVMGNLAVRPTINGVLFDNVQRCRVGTVIVTGLDGFGITVKKCWDSTFQTLSTLKCGNATNYAVSIEDGTGNTNECVFNHIQAEQAQQKAVFVSANTYNCTFNVIHSEQALFNGVDYTHDIRGNFGVVFNSVRLTGQNAGHTAGPKVRFGCGDGQYNGVRIEDDSASNASILDILFGVVGGMQTYSNVIVQGSIFQKAGNQAYVTWNGLNLTGRLEFEDTFANPTVVNGSNLSQLQFDANNITCVTHDTIVTAWTTTGGFGQVLTMNGGSWGGGAIPGSATIKLNGTAVSGAVTYGTGSILVGRGAALAANIALSGNASLLDVDDCSFANGITLGAGTPSWKFGRSNRISAGAVSAGLLAAPGGTYQFYAGEVSHNPVTPAAGVPAWTCTVSGTPGTWKAWAAIAA